MTTAYPVIRGTVPIATTVISIFVSAFLIDRFGIMGILLIAFGVLFINQTRFSLSSVYASLVDEPGGMLWALTGGIFIAVYNVSDSMAAGLMSVVLFKYLVFVGMWLGIWLLDTKLCSGVSYTHLAGRYAWETVFTGVLMFGANVPTVYAMKTTPVAYVASVMEMSVVFLTLIGVFWLKEK